MAAKTVKIEKVGSRIHLRCGWFEGVSAVCKKVDGARWRKSDHCWAYPLDFATCEDLRSVWGDSLHIGPALWTWAVEEKKRRQVLLAVSKAAGWDLAQVERIAPVLAAAMKNRTYQQVGAAFLAQAGGGLLADQPGLGKTLQALGAVIESQHQGLNLIVAPATAVTMTWKPELKTWLAQDQVFTCAGSRKKRQSMIDAALASEGRRWLIINPEMLEVPHWTEKKFSALWGGEAKLDADAAVTKWCVEEGDKVNKGQHLAYLEDDTYLDSPNNGTVLCRLDVPVGVKIKEESVVFVIGNPDPEVPRVRKYKAWTWRDLYYADLERPYASVVVDESHQSLITHTGNIKDQQWVRQGLGRLAAPLRIAMSGTPFRGKMTNLWGTLNWLRPDRFTSYWRWVEKWFTWYEDAMTGHRVIEDLLPHRTPAFYAELDSLMIRRTKAEVAPDLRPKEYAGRKLKGQHHGTAGVWLPMSPTQTKAYAEMRHDAAAQIEGGTLMGNGLLSEMTRLRQFASTSGKMDEDGEFRPSLPSNKFDWLVSWLDKRGISKKDSCGSSKVVIASQWSQVLNLFSDELNKLGIETLMITGDVSSTQREKNKINFQTAGGPRVLLLTTTAGGVSLTLDAFADDLVFIDETFVADDQEQVEDRIHRVSRIHRTTYWYLRSLGTIEHAIALANVNADQIQKHVLDGRRGIEITRKLISEELALEEA